MKHKIDYLTYEAKEGEEDIAYIVLEIDKHKFVLDKGDVWNLHCIADSVFSKMIDGYEVTEILETATLELLDTEE